MGYSWLKGLALNTKDYVVYGTSKSSIPSTSVTAAGIAIAKVFLEGMRRLRIRQSEHGIQVASYSRQVLRIDETFLSLSCRLGFVSCEIDPTPGKVAI